MIKFPQRAGNPRQHARQFLGLARALFVKHPAIGFEKRPVKSLRREFIRKPCIARAKRHTQSRRINRLLFHIGRKGSGQPIAAFKPRVNGVQRHTLQKLRNIRIVVNDAKPARPILQILQRLGIGLRSVGMIHPLHDRPRRVTGPLRPRPLDLLVQRFNAKAIRRPACQLFNAFAFQDCGHAGPPHVQGRVRKIIHSCDASAPNLPCQSAPVLAK